MRPIDADALEYKHQALYKKGNSDEIFSEKFITATEINNAPTIDVVPHWIPCEEKLPGDNIVLVTHDNIIDSGIYNKTTDEWAVWGGSYWIWGQYVTAWMPLPDPYKRMEKKMSDKQKIKLKPCPFCGGEAKIFVPGDGGICVMCTECQCQTPYRDDIRPTSINFGFSLEEVIDKWNKRQNKERENNETD